MRYLLPAILAASSWSMTAAFTVAPSHRIPQGAGAAHLMRHPRDSRPGDRRSLMVRWEGEGGEVEGERELSTVEKRRIARAEKERKAKMISKDQRLLEDFLGKRMGQGSTFYGERWSEMDDEKFEKLAPIRNDELTEVKPLRENPVVVIGATGQTGQWVVTDLLSKGFAVRAFVRNLDRAEDLYGFDGANLDIYEGDVRKPETLNEALRGALACLYCAGSREIWGGNSFKQVDAEGVENAVKAAQRSGCKSDDPRERAPPSVRKFVLLSSIGVTRPDELGFLNTLAGDPLGWKLKGEEAVRRGGLESYVVVRAAGLRESNDGVKKLVEIGQGDKFGRSGISRLDVATVLVQALVQDVNDVTFEVKNGDEEMDSEALQSIFETSDTREIVQYFLEEDAAEDEYYARRFAMLQPDRPAQ